MFYVLSLILFIVLYYVFAKIMSSIVKGILVSLFVLIVVLTGFILYKSSNEPINLLGIYRIYNFEVVRINR